MQFSSVKDASGVGAVEARVTASATTRVAFRLHGLDERRSRLREFVERCRTGRTEYRLTPQAEATPFARCFALFSLHLLHDRDSLDRDRDALVEALLHDLLAKRAENSGVPKDKGYRQLLCFTLSALTILGGQHDTRLKRLIEEQLPDDLESDLRDLGALKGRAQSGNQAMFLAIFLLHAKDFLERDTQRSLDLWLSLHRHSANRFGFWGPDAGPTHLHFQNGYHQYEIFEYLGERRPDQAAAIDAVVSLADPSGHFAPYPGGGGCFDYDAAFVLTPDGKTSEQEASHALLGRTAASISEEQQKDGGFCESQQVRPRLRNLTGFLERIGSARNPQLLKERARYALALQRPKHDRIHTHWSFYQRAWGESNLWDSWFRMLTLARIACAFDPGEASQWGFIDYPGIGWHPSLRRSDTP